MTNTIDLTIDPDVQELIDDIFGQFADPTVEPDAAAVWETLREVGFARLTAPEEQGGSGAGWAEAQALVRTAAKHGVAVPFAETDLIAGPLRRAAGLDDSADAITAFGVVGSDGVARNVAWAKTASSIVLARRAGDAWEVADVAAADIEIEDVQGISADPLGNVRVTGSADWRTVSADAVEKAVATGALVRAIACCGALDGMVASAIEHTTQRHQFGLPLAKFQSVQNLVVDAAAEALLASSATEAALHAWVVAEQSGDAADYERALFQLAVARSTVAHAVGLGVRNTHQAHGAIGTTHEHTLHRRTLPALQWRAEFGETALWEGALQELALAGGRDGLWPIISEGAGLSNVPAKWLTKITG